jgi:hypothetical protein
VPETRRDEQKLWLILFQIKGVRSRLNFLALQRWVFAALALLIGAVGVTFFAATTLGPLAFLGLAVISTVAAMVGVIRETMLVRAMRASAEQAAALADDRSRMQGRLVTVLALTESPRRSALWPYLVEDTYSRRENYEPSRIEPRWLSRAFYVMLASILLAVLALSVTQLKRRQSIASSGGGVPGRATADVGNLDIRPADLALQPNAEIYADPEALKKLADQLASGDTEDRHRRGLSKSLDQARNFADAFQNKLSGLDRMHLNPLRMRLTDSNLGQSSSQKSYNSGPGRNDNVNGLNGQNGNGLAKNSQRTVGSSRSGVAGASPPGGDGAPQPVAGENSSPPMTSSPPQQADELASNPATQSDQEPKGAGSPASGVSANGGSNHGSGSDGSSSDPANLLGPASALPLGSDSFKIAIEANPSDESTAPGSPTYVPPRIRVPLNSNQYPDQPLARAAVPTADQNTIKRVFQR